MALPSSTTPRSKPVLYFFAGIALITFALGIVAGFRGRSSGPTKPALLVYCAASLKAVMTTIAAEYQRETGSPIELAFGGSQTLLANLAITERGDLFLPADESYLVLARERNLVSTAFPVASQTAVIAVQRGNPKQIKTLADFRDTPATLSQANPDAAAVGQLLRAATMSNGLWLVLSNRTTVFKPNVTDAANDVKLGAVDAAIVWDSMQILYPELEFVHAPELQNVKATVSIGVLKSSSHNEAAEKFAHYVASPEKGVRQFMAHGFHPLLTPR